MTLTGLEKQTRYRYYAYGTYTNTLASTQRAVAGCTSTVDVHAEVLRCRRRHRQGQGSRSTARQAAQRGRADDREESALQTTWGIPGVQSWVAWCALR